MHLSRNAVVGILLSGSLALFANYVSASLHPRFEHREESISKEFAILEGRPFVLDGKPAYFPEFQNRVLFALALRTLSNVGILSPREWYMVLRIVLAFTAFMLFWHVTQTIALADARTAAAALVLLAVVMAFQFNHGWEHPSDFLDPIFATLMIWASVRKSRLAILAVAVIASFSRESSVFAGLIWMGANALGAGKTIRWRQVLFGAGVSALAYLCVLGARSWFGGPEALRRAQTLNIENFWPVFLAPALRHPTPTVWPVLLAALLVPVVLWIVANRQYLTPSLIGLLGASAIISLASIALASIDELRILLPVTPVLIFVAAALEARRQATDQGGRDRLGYDPLK
jgi:hypothetical protein